MTFIAGYCPACTLRTLFIDRGGNVVCSYEGCPDPTLLADLLDQHRPEKHIAVLTDDDNCHLEHPIRCRIDGLANCAVQAAMVRLPYLPVTEPGRYEVDLDACAGVLICAPLGPIDTAPTNTEPQPEQENTDA